MPGIHLTVTEPVLRRVWSGIGAGRSCERTAGMARTRDSLTYLVHSRSEASSESSVLFVPVGAALQHFPQSLLVEIGTAGRLGQHLP